MQELAKEYNDSAALLRARLKELRAAEREAVDIDEKWHIKRRIAVLTPMLTECNRISKYCRCYYEKQFFIQDGPFPSGRGRKHKHGKKDTVNREVVEDSNQRIAGTPKAYFY